MNVIVRIGVWLGRKRLTVPRDSIIIQGEGGGRMDDTVEGWCK